MLLGKLSSRSPGETGRVDSRSAAMLLIGMAEGQVVLSSTEWMNAGKVSFRALKDILVCCLLLPQKTLPQLKGSASLVDTAANLPELSWNSLIPFLPSSLSSLG